MRARFDDGLPDFVTVARPAVAMRQIRSPLDVAGATTGDRMPDCDSVLDVGERSVEVGAHSHTHPQLAVLARSRACDEIMPSTLLEEHLGTRVRSLARPRGYSSPSVRGLVREAGFDSACAVWAS